MAYLVAELFELHDRTRFEITAYSIGPREPGPTRERIAAGVDHWVDLSTTSTAEAAHRIHSDGIDILVDMMGHTHGARPDLMALRPAPIQVNYLGYPGTSGAPFIDYIIADPFIIPPGADADFSEAVVRLPHCYQPNDRRRPGRDALPERERWGLPDHGVVYSCFNTPFKLDPGLFDLWLEILTAVDAGVLWLLDWGELARDRLQQRARERGVDPERLIFAPRAPLAEHLARARAADLFLDTFPYTAHTTCSDMLWVGVPVLTRVGDTFASRVAGSLLHGVGLPQLVCTDPTAYRNLAIDLGRNPDQLAAIKADLEKNRDTHPLFDTPRYAGDLERAYLEMVRRHRAGEPPGPIT